MNGIAIQAPKRLIASRRPDAIKIMIVVKSASAKIAFMAGA